MNLFTSEYDRDDIKELSSSNVPATISLKSMVRETKMDTPLKVLPEEIPIDYDNRISFVKHFDNLNGYDDFTKEKYPRSINFYDFEVFACDWCVTFINPVERTKDIIVNDEKAFKRYYIKHKNEIWCGYNSRYYDSIIVKALLCKMNPKTVSDKLIILGLKAWEINRDFFKIQLYDFDIYDGDGSLKQLEAFMGDDIRETEIPFDIQRHLTRQEILRTVKYNNHDVVETIKVFRLRKAVFDSQIQLIETFNMPFETISLTQAQLTAKILECERVEGRKNDEFNFQLLPCIHLRKYRYIKQWFEQTENRDYKKKLETTVAGIPHIYGWGGLHGASDEPIYRTGRILHVDVASYYPSLMIQWNLLTRNTKQPKKYENIYKTRLELKHAGKKKEQAPYKIILNGTYGICKDKYSLAYDPMQANAICINGQLLLTDLVEHLEPHCEIIQSNTDGLIVRCFEDTDENEQRILDVCKEWENRTKMGLEVDHIDFIIQKDVNNYLFRFTNGKLERKGAMTKENNELDNDLPILNRALVDYFSKGIPVEQTINESKNLIDFQKIVRVKSDFKFCWHNGKFMMDKTYRVFASTDYNDTWIGRCKTKVDTVIKFGNTPEHCFIMNEDIHGKWNDKLDKQWYIDEANKRVKSFKPDYETRMGGLF